MNQQIINELLLKRIIKLEKQVKHIDKTIHLNLREFQELYQYLRETRTQPNDITLDLIDRSLKYLNSIGE